MQSGGRYLGRAWASPTLAWLHCACACVCLYACLLVWTDHIPEILNMRFHLHVHNSNSNSNSKKIHGVLIFFMFFNANGSTIRLNHDGVAEYEGKIASWARRKGYCQATADALSHTHLFNIHASTTRRNRLQQHSLWAPWVQVMSFFTRSWNSFIIYLLAQARPHNV